MPRDDGQDRRSLRRDGVAQRYWPSWPSARETVAAKVEAMVKPALANGHPLRLDNPSHVHGRASRPVRPSIIRVTSFTQRVSRWYLQTDRSTLSSSKVALPDRTFWSKLSRIALLAARSSRTAAVGSQLTWQATD